MATAAAATAEAIGPYSTIRQLGSGAMGEVFLARDPQLGRQIAIKLLPSDVTSAEQLARLRHEARTASSLNHPNIVTIYEIGDDGGRGFISMEYIEGQTLREILGSGAMPIRKALQIGAQIADGLAAAHKRGLVHRDLKPENIMITSEGVVKILDFGLAKATGIGNDSTRSFTSDPGTIVGTYAYMSPEQARAGEVDYRSDQFALGAILYEMLSGARAFEGESGVETLFMVVRDEPAPLAAVASHVPPPVRWIVDRCLSKDPEERYVATRDLARDLQYLRDHFSEAGVTPIRTRETLATQMKRRWRVAVMIAAAFLVGAGIVAYLRKPQPRTITTERYLTYSGADYSPAVSPDGKLIAFSSNRDGTQRVWIRQVASGGEVALTAGPDDFPRFSPDGASLLYVHADVTSNTASLWRVPVVGGEPRRIIDLATTGEWSPDGNQIAFTRGTTNGAPRTVIAIANADGSNTRELFTADTAGFAHPRWSPDGKTLALVGPRGGRVVQAVLLINVANGQTRMLSMPAKSGEISTVVWANDGKSVLYVRSESVEAVVGSAARLIRHDIKSDVAEEIGWTSHNGGLLDVLGDGRLVLDVRSPRDNLREISLTGDTTERWITRGNSSDRQPVYAPDGSGVLFTSNRSGNLDLWLVRADGTTRRITDDAAEDWDPAFTADAKQILWSSGRSGNLEIWIANADGSGARQVSHDGVDAENPSATPDGKWIVYNSFHPKKRGLWKVRPDGTGETRIVDSVTSLPELSPDSQYAAYIANGRTARAAIRVVRVSDGQDQGFAIPIRPIHRTLAILGRVRWMSNDRIAYLGQNDDGTNGVFVQDFVPNRDTSATRKALGGFDREYAAESFGISPDGKTMTVAGWEQLFSLFSIEGVPGVTTKRKEN
ncbi:MAG TPA: protein kinase [Thermoanaerobaculia bacterium]|nr:protein kinase [Thermoanaerobaculia bacterium]